MAKLFPKKKAWARVREQLLKHRGNNNHPPELAGCDDNWDKNSRWDKTITWAKQYDAYDIIQNMSDDDFYAATPFKPADLVLEDFSGDIGKLLIAINAETTWNKQKRHLIEDLIALLNAEGYIGLAGHGPTYGITTVGSSFIYKVPKTKQGSLKPYRGKTVRIICVGSGRHTDRYYMIGLYKA